MFLLLLPLFCYYYCLILISLLLLLCTVVIAAVVFVVALFVVVFVSVALLSLPSGPVLAAESSAALSPLSVNHTLHGVSQLLVGTTGPGPDKWTILKLSNPTPIPMVALAFFYEREGCRGGMTVNGEAPANFDGCGAVVIKNA